MHWEPSSGLFFCPYTFFPDGRSTLWFCIYPCRFNCAYFFFFLCVRALKKLHSFDKLQSREQRSSGSMKIMHLRLYEWHVFQYLHLIMNKMKYFTVKMFDMKTEKWLKIYFRSFTDNGTRYPEIYLHFSPLINAYTIHSSKISV